ncbi:hypothetical protein FACS1894151_09190 [Spirochaetia bacterium]|nr:hypothetical protein FACS1894151_09190 [Spirochaetia bacterium]
MKPVILSPAFCAANGVVITKTEGDTITLGMLHPEDITLRARIEKIFPETVFVFVPLDNEPFNLILSRLYEEDETGMETANNDDDANSGETSIDKVVDDAPVINLLNSIFLEAISLRASDIHIESTSGESQVRYRIDGVLFLKRTITREKAVSVSTRLKLLANLNVLETRRPQDGHIDITTGTYALDVRISINPTIWGESIVLRLLNRSDKPLTLEALGFSDAHLVHIRKLLNITSGLVLVTGPTGSGKTTTPAFISCFMATSTLPSLVVPILPIQ